MANPQVACRAQEIAELIQRTLSEGLVTHVVKDGNTFYVSGVPRNLKAGTHTPTTITYAVTETPNSVKVMGPDSTYHRAGQLLHALALNVEEDLALKDINPILKLRPNLLFEQEYRQLH